MHRAFRSIALAFLVVSALCLAAAPAAQALDFVPNVVGKWTQRRVIHPAPQAKVSARGKNAMVDVHAKDPGEVISTYVIISQQGSQFTGYKETRLPDMLLQEGINGVISDEDNVTMYITEQDRRVSVCRLMSPTLILGMYVGSTRTDYKLERLGE